MSATAVASEAAPEAGTTATVPCESAAWRRILVALDGSDHAEHALREAVRLASGAGGEVCGIHVYAARLHDRRFREMESGLPERYRAESALEHQRAVHDELITRGLRLISDSYHDHGEAGCQAAGVPYRRINSEGKNYRGILEAARSDAHDLLVLGAQGLGLGAEAPLGTVCIRVARRCPVDLLVVRGQAPQIGAGPLVAALDGSPRSFSALRAALRLGQRLGAPVHAVATFDPYFHYVAFGKIARVLSEQARETFRFEDQERLHAELIDGGLAKIYRSYLDVGRAIAAAGGIELACELRDGKPYQAILRYIEEVGASLLLVGKTGMHADAELDIGGNAENLLRLAPCSTVLAAGEYEPPLEMMARETICWTEEAEYRLERVPQMVRAMVRTAILQFASERGHTVVTASVVDEATARLCPHARPAEPG